MKGLVFILILVLLTSCGGPKKKHAYIKWVHESSEFQQVTEQRDFTLTALYKPHAYIIANEFSSSTLNRAGLDQRKKELGNLHYFNLKIQNPNQERALLGQDQKAYFQKLEYYLTQAQNKIYLLNGQDTTYPSIYHFERYFNLTDYHMINLGFEKSEANHSQIQLVFEGEELDLGTSEFNFNIKSDYPQLIPDDE